MADPQQESPGTTHTYVALPWYKDWQTWFNILSIGALLLQEKDIITVIPERYHGLMTALVTAVNLILRFTITTRPVAMSSGTTREVQSLAPKNDPPSSGARVLPILLLCALGAGVLMTPSCAKAPPALSPAGTAAFNATRVVKALDVLRDVAIDAEAQSPKLISTANTRKIVSYHEAAVKTIGAVPGGWRPTVLAGLEQLRAEIPAGEYARIAPFVALVQTLIAEVSQ